MHAPWEVASKVDIYETMRGYKAFLIENNIKKEIANAISFFIMNDEL